MHRRGIVSILALCASACSSRVLADDASDVTLDAASDAFDSFAFADAPIDTRDAADVPVVDATPITCPRPLEAVPHTIVLRPVPGYDTNDPMPAFRARAENAVGDVIEVEAGADGILRIDVGDRPGPWDVTVARHGWYAVSILGLDAPHTSDVVIRFGFASELRPDPIVPSSVSGTIAGWSSARDRAWLATADAPMYSVGMVGCEPFRIGAVEFDATGMPRNALLSPWIRPVRSNITLDLAFPSTPPSLRHSVMMATLPSSGTLSVPTSMGASVIRAPDDARGEGFGALQTAFDAAAHSIRFDIDHFGDGYEPDGIRLHLEEASSPWTATSWLAPIADGAIYALPMPGELALAGTTVDDYTMQIDAAGFDDVVFTLRGQTAQDHGGWAVFAAPAALATMRHWPRLPSMMTGADVMDGYPEWFAATLNVCAQQRANGVVPWSRGFDAVTRHAVCRRVALR